MSEVFPRWGFVEHRWSISVNKPGPFQQINFVGVIVVEVKEWLDYTEMPCVRRFELKNSEGSVRTLTDFTNTCTMSKILHAYLFALYLEHITLEGIILAKYTPYLPRPLAVHISNNFCIRFKTMWFRFRVAQMSSSANAPTRWSSSSTSLSSLSTCRSVLLPCREWWGV